MKNRVHVSRDVCGLPKQGIHHSIRAKFQVLQTPENACGHVAAWPYLSRLDHPAGWFYSAQLERTASEIVSAIISNCPTQTSRQASGMNIQMTAARAM